MNLPQLSPEQVDLYLKLIGGALGLVTTVVVGTLLPAIRNFKTAQAAAPAQAASDMVTSASKMAASVAAEALVKWTQRAGAENRAVTPADQERALAEGIAAGLEMLVKSGIWPTIAEHFPREKLVAAFKAYMASKSPVLVPVVTVPVVPTPEGVDTSAVLTPGVVKGGPQ